MLLFTGARSTRRSLEGDLCLTRLLALYALSLRRRTLSLSSDSTCHFVALAVPGTLPSLAREARQLKAALPQNLRRERKVAAHVPPLDLHREWRLHHSPTVVARSSMGCDCTKTRWTVSDVRQRRRRPHLERRQGERAKQPPLPSLLGPGTSHLRSHSSARAKRRTRGKRVQVPSTQRGGRREPGKHGQRKPLIPEGNRVCGRKY